MMRGRCLLGEGRSLCVVAKCYRNITVASCLLWHGPISFTISSHLNNLCTWRSSQDCLKGLEKPMRCKNSLGSIFVFTSPVLPGILENQRDVLESKKTRTYICHSDCACPWMRTPRRSLCLARHSSCPWSLPSQSSPAGCCSLSPSASWLVSLGQRVHYVGMHMNRKFGIDMCIDK